MVEQSSDEKLLTNSKKATKAKLSRALLVLLVLYFLHFGAFM